jgi:CRISP-associated protein Cas1
MPTLYVTEPGSRIEKEYKRILVTSADDERIMSVPLAQVSEVVLVGSVGVTTQALTALLEQGVGLSIISASGRLLGRLQAQLSRNIILRHQQYACAREKETCLRVARAIVLGKVHNQRVLARRLCRTHPAIQPAPIERMSAAAERAAAAGEMGLLRGLEGQAAKAYFSILRQAIPAEWRFAKRTRRPPADPFNALLGLGYTLLVNNLFAAIEVAGLDPYDGFYHADVYGRPALALDLEEEFRAVIVDSVVLGVVNKGILDLEDFHPGEGGGVYLKQPALKKFLAQYNSRLQTEVFHPAAGRRLSYQKCFEVQARRMRKVIEGECEEYAPFLTR